MPRWGEVSARLITVMISLYFQRYRAFSARIAIACVSILALSALASNGTASAQQQVGQNPQSTENCSDMSNLGTAACAGQDMTVRSPWNGSQTGLTPLRPQIPSSYSDTEGFNRPVTQNQPPVPQPLSEFQKFAASATGQVLPIFGSNLFRSVPSTFAPLDATPVPADYLIGPGDELRIRVWGQVSFEANLRVDRSGDIYIPHVGPVHVASIPFSALQQHIREAIARVFRNFDLVVDIGQIRAIQIYVTGQAARPGVYTVSSLSTLLDALFTSGGPSAHGSLRHIQLKREGKLISEFDLYDLLTNGDKSRDTKLLNGDIVFIPPVGPQVAITGSVRNERIYELKDGETLKDLLADAGGSSTIAAETNISISRIDQHRALRTISVDFNPSGLATSLLDGDLIHVYSIVPRLKETVTLRGNLASPGRFPWHAGMHVSDLIPDKDSLLTRDYWWKRAQLGVPAPEFEPIENLQQTQQFQQNTRLNQPINVREQLSANQPDQWVQPAGSFDQTNQQSASGTAPGNGTPASNSTLASSSTLAGNGTVASSQKQLEGLKGQGPNQVRFLAPEIDWDYAVVERLDPETLKNKLIPFDLGRLVLNHDSTQDPELQPGDVVTIFSEADIRLPIAQQSKMVKLEGEFVHAGTYSVKPGETLRDLVERAGGFTPNAYLYGSEFTRQSIRVIQQQRIDEYVRSMEVQVQRSNLANAASGLSTPQNIAGNAATQASAQALVSQLRQMRATGRMVLEFTPASQGTTSIPVVALENGDTFVVPSRPSGVNVVGAVYDQNTFLYNPSRRVGTYLHLAGGPDRNADRRHEFIIRANGEVVSRETVSGAWTNGFANLRVNPGDTIVVPEKTFRPSAVRGFLDWSQTFSQLAVGSAAISVLR